MRADSGGRDVVDARGWVCASSGLVEGAGIGCRAACVCGVDCGRVRLKDPRLQYQVQVVYLVADVESWSEKNNAMEAGRYGFIVMLDGEWDTERMRWNDGWRMGFGFGESEELGMVVWKVAGMEVL